MESKQESAYMLKSEHFWWRNELLKSYTHITNMCFHNYWDIIFYDYYRLSGCGGLGIYSWDGHPRYASRATRANSSWSTSSQLLYGQRFHKVPPFCLQQRVAAGIQQYRTPFKGFTLFAYFCLVYICIFNLVYHFINIILLCILWILFFCITRISCHWHCFDIYITLRWLVMCRHQLGI